MRITYVTQTRFPTEKAHGYQIAQVCAAMAALGHDVTLVAPTVGKEPGESPFQGYGIPASFTVTHLRHFDALNSPWIPGSLAFAVSMFFYGRALRQHFRVSHPALLYARSPVLLPALLQTSIPVVLELHALPRFRRSAFVRLVRRCTLVVCLTHGMRQEILSWGVPPETTIVEGDGVDVDRFARSPDSTTAKKQWRLPSDRSVIGYVGSLVTRDTIEKGVAELVDAMAILKQKGAANFCWIVGGPAAWVERFRRHAFECGLTERDIRFEGHIAARDTASAISACDVCVYPAPKSNHPYFLRDTSPLKLLEYLAAGKPIVCADLPPIHDLVDATMVRFCTPGDAQSLASMIDETLSQPRADATALKSVAARHSWRHRMQRILALVAPEHGKLSFGS